MGREKKKSRVYQEHNVLIELVKSLKAFPISVIIQNITEILKQSSLNNSKEKKKSPLNVWLLQFLHSYLDYYITSSRSRTIPTNRQDSTAALLNLTDLAGCLCTFFKESLSSSATSNFAPACYFQLFRILHDSVNNFSVLVDDKKFSKDIQDATHKLFELCNSIVASSLQQTTWLRKNFAVKLTPNSSVVSNNPASVVIAAGAGPSVGGGAILIHNDSNISVNSANTTATSLSNSSNLSNTSGFVGSSTMMASNNSSTSSTIGNSAKSNFSDIENGIFV